MNTMLISSSLPQNMWGEVILSANYLLNKVPKKKVEKTLYELWRGQQSSYKYLRVWGCLAKVVVPPPKKVEIGHKLLIAFSLVMHIIVLFIAFLSMSRISQIFTRT